MNRWYRKLKQKKNVKVKNATKCELDGIKFRSKLEMFTYKTLKEAKIPFKYEEHKFQLIPKFEYNNEKIRECTYTPDFIKDVPKPGEFNWLIECKGWGTDSFKIKFKLLKWVLKNSDINFYIYIVKNKKEVVEVVEDLKKRLKNE